MSKIKIIFLLICFLLLFVIIKLQQSAIITGGSIFSHKNIIDSMQTFAIAIICYVLYKYFNNKQGEFWGQGIPGNSGDSIFN